MQQRGKCQIGHEIHKEHFPLTPIPGKLTGQEVGNVDRNR